MAYAAWYRRLVTRVAYATWYRRMPPVAYASWELGTATGIPHTPPVAYACHLGVAYAGPP